MKQEKSCLRIESHRSTCSLKRKSSKKLQESNPKAQRSLKVLNQGLDQDHLDVKNKQSSEGNDTSLTKRVLQTSRNLVKFQGKIHLIKRNHGEEVFFNAGHLSCKKLPLLPNYQDTKNETCCVIKAQTLSKKTGLNKRLKHTSLISIANINALKACKSLTVKTMQVQRPLSKTPARFSQAQKLTARVTS